VAALGATAVSCVTAEPSPAPTSTVGASPAATAVVRASASPRPRFDVRTFGAVADGRTDDAKAIAAAVKAATQAGPGATVSLPRGRYLLAAATTVQTKTPYPPAQGIGDNYIREGALIALQDARDLTLEGEDGTTLIARDASAAAIGLYGCRNVTVRSVAIDYEQVHFTQGTVAAVNESANTIDLSVQTGYPDPTSPLFKNARTWFTVRPAATPLVLRTNTAAEGQVFFSDLSGLRAVGGALYRVSGVTRGQLAGVVAGDRFVFGARDNEHPGAVAILFSQECLFERVTIYGAPVLAFRPFFDDGLTFRECVIEPLPGSDRLQSTNADGIHCKYNRTGPKIERCRFSGMADDAFTIHGSGARVLRADGTTLISERHEFYRVGDELILIDSGTGRPRGTAKIVDAGLTRWRDQIAVRIVLDKAISGTRSYEAMYGDAPLSPRLDQTTPPDRRPDIIADVSAVGSGFSVRGCTFSRHQGTSRIYAANGVVEDNRFEAINRHGLQVGMELYWPEVYSGQDLVIRRNQFVGIAGETNIRIQDKLGLLTRAGQGLGNRGIEISENRFEGYGPEGAVFVSNAQDVKLAGNDFVAGATDVPVALDLCRSVSIESAKPLKVSTTAATDMATLTLKGPVTTVRK
jgi:hypothetical protein